MNEQQKIRYAVTFVCNEDFRQNVLLSKANLTNEPESWVLPKSPTENALCDFVWPEDGAR